MAAPSAGPTVFAVYDQLRREIQALLQENEDLKRIVTQLREQRNQRHNVRGPPGALVPSSAPPILGTLPAPGPGQFPFPGSGSSLDSSLGLSQLFHSQPSGHTGTGSLDSSLGLSHVHRGYPWESTRLSSLETSLGLNRLFQSQPGDASTMDSSLGLSRLFQSHPGDASSPDSSLGLSRLFQSYPGDTTLSSGSLNSWGGLSGFASCPSFDSSFGSSDSGSEVESFIESFAPNRSLPVPKHYYYAPQRWEMPCPGRIETGPSMPGPSGPAPSGAVASGPSGAVASGPGPSGAVASGPSDAVASGSGPSGAVASGPGPSGPSPGDVPLCCQLVGEMVYQLDRRMLAHVFPTRQRFYGFTVSNIPEKIMVTVTNPQDYVAATRRYAEMMPWLRRRGYNPQMHPLFCEALINTYGTLNEATRPAVFGAVTVELLNRAIEEAVPLRARLDASIMLDCLLFMVRMDGGPIFMY
ncbi:speriolin isoform X3 [Columba livia]|uniref:speriolin isoform X3 n=1 Tax=Columba livia TaxID=8932 RepID=UPI0031BB3441